MRHKRRSRTLRRCLIAGFTLLFVLGLLAGIVAFNLSSPQLKERVVTTLGNELQPECKFSPGRVYYRFGEGFIIEDFQLCSPSGFRSSDFVKIKRLTAVPKLGSLLRGVVAFSMIEIDGCEVSLERAGEKQWNFMGILRPKPTTGTSPDRVRLKNCTVCVDARSLSELLEIPPEDIPDAWRTLRIDGEVDARRDRMALSATVSHACLDRVQIEGALERKERRGTLALQAFKVPVDAQVLRVLPRALREWAEPYEPAGSVDLHAQFIFEPDRETSVRVEGRVFNGQATVPSLPYQVRHVNGAFVYDGETLSFPGGVEGKIAEGVVKASGAFAVRGDGTGTLAASIDRLALDERLAEKLPENVRTFWKRLNLRGEVGVEAALTRAGGTLAVRGTVTLRGVDVAYEQLPYAVNDVRGAILYDGERVRTESPLRGTHGATVVTASLDVETREGGRVDVIVRAAGVSLDQYLRSCLAPETRKVWDQFRLEGTADAEIAFVRTEGLGAPRLTVTLQGTDARMCYVHFPYTIEGITGTLVINHDDVEALDLVGVHGKTQVRCRKGFWRIKDGKGQYAFVFESPRMAVDQDLSRALPEAQRRVLEEFHFNGSVATKVTVLQLPEHASMHLEIEADLQEGRMEYVRFPYSLRLKGGRLYIGPSIIRIENLQTDEPELFVCLERGTIEDLEDERKYDFRLHVKRLRPEPALIRALPAHVAKFLTELAVEGVFDAARISVSYTHKKSDPDDFTLQYLVEDLVGEDVAMNLGMRFRHMKGKATILGAAGKDVPHRATGKIELERMRFNRLWLTNVVLKCAYGARHELVKALARDLKSVPEMQPLGEEALKAFVARLPDEAAARDNFQVWISEGQAYEGTLKGFIAADVGARKDLTGAVHVEGMDLSRASQDIFRGGEATGTASADAFFQGTIADVATFTGKGRGQLKEANLVKLPLFVSMFRDILTVQRIKDSYFHLVKADFAIEGGKFVASGGEAISMESDVMTLRGFGTVDFDLNCDLYLSLPSFGLPEIPLVSSFLRLIVDNLAVFHVTGSIDEPQINPMMMRDLQRLFGGEHKK